MRPQLQSEHRKRLFVMPAALAHLASMVGLALFACSTAASTARRCGGQLDPTFIYVIFWVGFPLASVIFGDIFQACARGAVSAAGPLAGPQHRATNVCKGAVALPRASGHVARDAVIVGFAWMELVYIFPDRDQPSTLAALSLAYFLAMLAGMALFGVEDWSEQADGFGACFNLLSRMSVLCQDEHGVAQIAPPLERVARHADSRRHDRARVRRDRHHHLRRLLNGEIWRTNEPSLQSLVADLGFNQTPALELTYSVGLVLCVLLVAGIYRLGIVGVHSVSTRFDMPELSRTFAHTLVPIGFAYVLAHYFSLLIWQGQAIGALASDPLGNGANYFGTSASTIDYTIISYAAIWYVQVAALVSGHVGGLALAHDRALSIYPNQEQAIRSQYWMLAVMVAFTSFGLWLLSAVGT